MILIKKKKDAFKLKWISGGLIADVLVGSGA